MTNFKQTGHLTYWVKNQNGFNNAIKHCYEDLYERTLAGKDDIRKVLHPAWHGDNWPKKYPAVITIIPTYTGSDTFSVDWRPASWLSNLLHR